MKKNLLTILWKTLPVALLLLSSSKVSGQQLRTAYFMENSPLNTQLNPAFRPDRGYVAIPVIGALGARIGSNLCLSDMIFYVDGKNKLFTEEGVVSIDGEPGAISRDKFLKNLNTNNRFDVDLNFDIANVGWYKGEGFWTVGLGMRNSFEINLPKSAFEYALEVSRIDLSSESALRDQYRIKNLNVGMTSYVQASVGYSRPITDKLTVGAAVKLLGGLADFDFRIKNAHVISNADGKYEVNASAELNANLKGATIETKTDENGEEYFVLDDLGLKDMGLAGFGVGFDLGATYKIMDNLTVSASILDLGFISWGKGSNIHGKSHTDRIIDGSFSEDSGDIGGQLENLLSTFEDLARVKEQQPKGRVGSLRTTINIGAEYTILDDLLGFGLLSSTRFGKSNTYSEVTLSTTVKPTDWFTGALSYSFVYSYFRTFGIAFNFHTPYINFFLGSDYVLFGMKHSIPSNQTSANIYMGIAIPLGKKNI